ncbi:MAG: prephenate dehydrogenase [Tissierellia bacterium]|nr:prephenate dehydrogenase [Tissierellia bacterium]
MRENFDIHEFNITIIGLGLLGGSYAKSLKKLNPKNIWAVDIDEKALKDGEELGVIDRGYTNPKEPLLNSDLVIICLYPNLVYKFIDENKEYFKPHTIITDSTGIKNGLVDEINRILPDNVDFVFGHPMAGREKKGLEYSSAEVFEGANYILTPNSRNKETSLLIVELIARGMGFRSVVRVNPQKHDEIISFTSQLPHAIAVALINSDNLNVNTGKFIGDSYKELTRIANINGELWSELFLGNKDNLVSKIEGFEEKLEIIKQAIINGDEETLIGEFRESSRRRTQL